MNYYLRHIIGHMRRYPNQVNFGDATVAEMDMLLWHAQFLHGCVVEWHRLTDEENNATHE